jgi:hypothetical protein
LGIKEKIKIDVATLSMLVFWVVTPFGLVGRYQHFGGSWTQYVP